MEMDMKAMMMLQPLIVLGLWTVIMMIWMYATRIPAMTKAGQAAQDAAHVKDIKVPSEVARIADNYNHLFEQPTLFYATALAIVAMGHVDMLHVQCAWGFVILRVIHSLVQATANVVMLRFNIFMLSWIPLIIMLVREAMMVF